jgi:hypothetical protein
LCYLRIPELKDGTSSVILMDVTAGHGSGAV